MAIKQKILLLLFVIMTVHDLTTVASVHVYVLVVCIHTLQMFDISNLGIIESKYKKVSTHYIK